jgi:hypothetical protein
VREVERVHVELRGRVGIMCGYGEMTEFGHRDTPNGTRHAGRRRV